MFTYVYVRDAAEAVVRAAEAAHPNPTPNPNPNPNPNPKKP